MDGIQIKTGDFREMSKQLADDSVDLVLTDPPYPKQYLPLWSDLGRVAARVLRPGGSLISYCGHYQVLEVGNLLAAHLRYWWLLMIEHTGPCARLPGKWVFAGFKPALWFVKERRGDNRYVADRIVSRPDKRYHKWGQGIGPLVYLIERLTNPGNLVLDPFMGGGTTAVACLQTGRRFIGYEIDSQSADVARRRIANAQLPLFTPQVTATQPALTALAAVRVR